MIKYENVDDFVRNIHKLATLATVETKTVAVAGGIDMQITAGYKIPRLQPVEQPGKFEYPMDVGQLGPFRVCVDINCCHAKMSPSREFLRVQHAELSYSLTEWMRDFFGLVYPIYVYEDRVVMHPKAYIELQTRLRA
jgi:hypothetical protein